MPRNDEIRLRHMLEAARLASSFASGRSRQDLDGDMMLVLSLVKCVEIIGEAAGRVSEETRVQFPATPWRQIIAMRNRLIHAYFNINLDISGAPLSATCHPSSGSWRQSLDQANRRNSRLETRSGRPKGGGPKS
jgi:uncharacterized protein with HEPN domain